MEKNLIILCILVFTLISVGIYYWDYFLPLHSDSWDNLAVANAIVRNEKVIFYNPCLPGETYYDIVGNVYEKEPEVPTNRWETCFDLFIGLFHILTGIKFIHLGVILPFLFSFIMSLGSFILIRKMFNPSAGFFSALFVLTYQTNVISLGNAFLVALSVGMCFLPVLSYLLITIKRNEEYIAFWVIFLYLILNHPVSALLVFVLGVITLLQRKDLINKRFMLISFFFLIVGLNYLIPIYKLGFRSIEIILNQLQFKGTTVQMNIAFKYSELIGFPSVLLGVIGFWFSVRKNRIINYMLVVPAVISFLYIQTGTAYLIPYDRAITYTCVSLLLLAGVGIAKLADLIKRYKWIVYICAFALLTLQLIHIYNSNNKIYKNILPAEVKIMNKIEKLKPDAIVIAKSHIAEAVCAISGKKVIALERGRIGSSYENLWDVMVFFNGDCNAKKSVIEKYNATHVYSRYPIECEFLKRINTDGGYLYEIVK